MRLYAIFRREGWGSAVEFQDAAARARTEADERMPDDIRWIRTYVLVERDGSLGSVCIFEASSPEAIRRHAALAELPLSEIVGIAETVTLQPDPAPAAAA
jgi:uncharacterized protein DUF4242